MKAHSCQDHLDKSSTLANATERLKSNGHKLTKPRQALLKAIASFSAPFTTEDAFKTTTKLLRGAKIDLVTVYRSLATFEELGLLSRVEFGDGVVRYELKGPGDQHHHHFVCQACAKVEPLNHCELTTHLKAAGYTRLSHRLEFFGLCPACAPKAKG
jgi:Fur family ferric uptake transcriptional regulator